MVQDTYQNGVGPALFVSGVLSNSALAYICVVYSGYPRPGRPRSAWVCPGQYKLAGSPRFSQEISDFPAILWVSGISWENLGVIFCDFVGFPGFPGRTWVDFLGEPGYYFCAFVGFPGFPGRTWVETVGDGPGRAARVCSGKIGRRVARYFDPQFLNFCRRRCCPLWPAGLPRFKV